MQVVTRSNLGKLAYFTAFPLSSLEFDGCDQCRLVTREHLKHKGYHTPPRNVAVQFFGSCRKWLPHLFSLRCHVLLRQMWAWSANTKRRACQSLSPLVLPPYPSDQNHSWSGAVKPLAASSFPSTCPISAIVMLRPTTILRKFEFRWSHGHNPFLFTTSINWSI